MGSGNISLREQLHKNTADYFTVKEVRGSSPAASLAADLSQNFRIDNEARLVSCPCVESLENHAWLTSQFLV
jgi:M-phase inducer tyrosine phosphatase